ncbi:MAG: prephenate dehydratase [Mycobacteriales bacterium]
MPPGRFAYLGPEGTFSEAALRTLPAAAGAELLPADTIPAALDLVREGDAQAALVPLENSVEGAVNATLDELAFGAPLQIYREVILPVSFALLARSSMDRSDISTVATIPHAEAQVRGWLRRELPGAQFVPMASTADGARAVAEGRVDAAIAAPIAAERYHLAVLAAQVHDVAGAQTRFVLVARPAPPPARTGADRTSLVAFEAEDRPGALLEILTEFAVRGVNLTRLESRPTRAELGRYCFSIDCEGHICDERVGETLTALRRICGDVRFLGSYPRADGRVSSTKRGTADEDFRDAAAWLRALRDGSGPG